MFGFSTTPLAWPTSTSGYSKYVGGFDEADDGYALHPLIIPDFAMQGDVYNTLYINTDGSITFDAGNTAREGYPSENTQICGNSDDLEIDPDNTTLTDGKVHNAYYKTGSGYTKILIYEGYHSDVNKVASYLINIYRDNTFQWVETRLKVQNNNNPYSGPYNGGGPDVSEPSSTVSKVWRSDLDGNNWTYMGIGSVYGATEVIKTCSNQGCGVLTGKVCKIGTSSCTCAQWKYFTAQCTRIQQALGICSGMSGAYVPAVTVCNQRLFS